MVGFGWKGIDMAGNGWIVPWFVPSGALVINTTGFAADDDDESNGMAFIEVLTVYCY